MLRQWGDVLNLELGVPVSAGFKQFWKLVQDSCGTKGGACGGTCCDSLIREAAASRLFDLQ